MLEGRRCSERAQECHFGQHRYTQALADPRGAGRGHAPLATRASAQNALKVAIFGLKVENVSGEGAMPPPQTPASFPLHKSQRSCFAAIELSAYTQQQVFQQATVSGV